MDDRCGREEARHRPETDLPVGVEVRVAEEEPDRQDDRGDGAAHGRRERDHCLRRRARERPFEDREGDERGPEELRVEGRLRDGEAEELVEAIPGRGQEEDRQSSVRERVHAQHEGLAEPEIPHCRA